MGKPEPEASGLTGFKWIYRLSLKVLAIACPTPPFSFSATSEHTHYNSATNSPRAQGDENEEGDRNEEIIEVPDMIDYENPIDVVNMNVIGKPSPPPGYHLKEDPPLQRFLKEVNRIWIAPALAGIPAFLVDNWWKNTGGAQ